MHVLIEVSFTGRCPAGLCDPLRNEMAAAAAAAVFKGMMTKITYCAINELQLQFMFIIFLPQVCTHKHTFPVVHEQ